MLWACEPSKPPAPPPPEVLVVEVATRDVPLISEWLGTTEGFVDASVRAQVSGYLIARDYQEGQLVKRGDLLFRIDPRPFQAALDQAQGQLASARATLERERLDVVRYTPLVKQGAVSQQEYDNAVQNERGAQASVQAAQAAVEAAKINLGFTEIRSPLDGIVGVAQAQLGDFVAPSNTEPLTAVSQLDPIRVSFPVSEQEYLHFAPRVAGGAPRRPFPRGLARADPRGRQRLPAPRHRLPGRPRRRSAHRHDHGEGQVPESGIPAADRPVRARARRDRRAQGRAGRPAARGDRPAGPQAARPGRSRRQGGGAQRRGRPDAGGVVVIEKGVAAGERVIVEGTQKVQPGMVVAPKPAPPDTAPSPSTDAGT